MDFGHEICEVRENFLSRFPGYDVVAAGAKENHFWLVRKNQPVGEMCGVHDLRAAEAAVDDFMFWKILGERLPARDGGRTNEEQRVFRRRIGFVGALVGCD